MWTHIEKAPNPVGDELGQGSLSHVKLLTQLYFKNYISLPLRFGGEVLEAQNSAKSKFTENCENDGAKGFLS